MFRNSRFILAVSVVAVLATSVAAQNRSTITGMARGPDGKALEKARVELRNDTTMSVWRAASDASGRFTFNNITAGRYTVRVLMPGTDLIEQSESIQIGASGNETVQLEFTLKAPSGRTVRAASVVFAQDVPDQARKFYESALAELRRDNPQAGVNDLVKAIEAFPTYFSALEVLGVQYMKHQMYPEARKAFTEAVAINSRSYDSWYGLSYANFGMKNWEEAVKAAEQALVIDKGSFAAYFVLGMSQRSLKRYEAAEKSLLKAKELDTSRKADIHWNLALLYGHNLLKYGKAADELELYLKASPDNPDAANIRKLIDNFRAKQAKVK